MAQSKRPDGEVGRMGASPTADQLRSEIDSGQARDKVASADPAMAPLGTDDEAAGTPPTGQQVRLARRHETGRGGADAGAAEKPPGGAAPANWTVPLIVGAVVMAAVIAVAFAI